MCKRYIEENDLRISDKGEKVLLYPLKAMKNPNSNTHPYLYKEDFSYNDDYITVAFINGELELLTPVLGVELYFWNTEEWSDDCLYWTLGNDGDSVMSLSDFRNEKKLSTS